MRWNVLKTAVCLGTGLILYYIKYGYLAIAYIKKRCGGPTCRCSLKLDNKFVIVTGGTSGLGLVVTEKLAYRGASIIFTARNLDEGLAIQECLRAKTKNPNIFCKHLDLNNFASIHNFVSDVNQLCSKVDLLINNAGVFFYPPKETVDKYDVTFQTNYLGHFLLTELLVPKLADKSRVIFVSSAAHSLTKSLDLSTVFVVDEGAQGISARFQNYANSKLCLLLYSKNFAQRFKERGVNVYSVDPGSVETPMYRHFPFLTNPILKAIQKPIRFIVVRSPIQGAQTILHCALSPNLSSETGLYYADLVAKASSDLSQDVQLSSQLYDHSRIWAGLSQSEVLA
uniref:Uncharacterized protein n=1 Tax=Daphnia galeata TaxID=27404 RepID=A0A8J2RL97_9CRUS|nr:unnamed protein product [Daphnia galeata]